MAKAVKKLHPVQWENTLPAVYDTILNGFHAGLTVQDMMTYLNLPIEVPNEIRDIKIGSFTPDAFAHWSKFWQAGISPQSLPTETYKALHDPDIAAVQKQIGYTLETDHPTLETLCRVAQAQFLGLNIRIGELTSKSMFARLEILKDPYFLKNLRQSPFVKANKLEKLIPEKIPDFVITSQKFSVKTLKSAFEKAYFRTGNPTKKDLQTKKNIFDVEQFLAKSDTFGVYAVTDTQRTKLQLISKQETLEEKTAFIQEYNTLATVLSISLLSGELGAVVDWNNHGELTDQVNRPKSAELKDLVPVFISKFTLYHEGPEKSYFAVPAEIQIPIMTKDLDDTTHGLYNFIREEENKPEDQIDHDAIQAMNASRSAMFNKLLPKEVVKMRHTYAEDKDKGVPDSSVIADPLAMIIQKCEVTGLQEEIKVYALKFSSAEFNRPADWDSTFKRKIIEFNVFCKNPDPLAKLGLDKMIKRTDEKRKTIIRKLRPA